MRAVEAGVICLVDDRVRILRLIGDGADCLLQDVAVSSSPHGLMLGRRRDLIRG
jgi:hypothetical protein